MNAEGSIAAVQHAIRNDMKANPDQIIRARQTLSAKSRFRTRFLFLAFLLQAAAYGAFAGDALDRRITLTIPANTRLEDALIEWGTKARMTVMINTTTVERHLTRGLQGTFSARQALVALLRDSGLSYTEDGDRIRVVPRAALQHSGFRALGTESVLSDSDSESDVVSENNNTADSGSSDTGPARIGLEEVVVTAQKREERLQDVPIPITAISAQGLVDSNQTKLLDFYSAIPNFNVEPNLFSQNNLSIRGITTGGFSSPTVGVLIDDVPYSSGNQVPDFDPSSLARVEVLRGPQGALYGASSMGGLLKYVTVDPSTDRVSGLVEAGTSEYYNGYSLGYSVRASINVPLTDQLAFRTSAFLRQDPGYLDNPLTHVRGVNEDHAAGGQLSVIWRPLDILSVKFGALYQDLIGNGSNDITTQDWNGNPVTGALQQAYIRGAGQYERKTQFYDATMTAKFGRFDITSVTGYGINNIRDSFDSTAGANAGQAEVFPVFGVIGAPVFDYTFERKFTEEIRLTGPLGPRIEGLLGAFYSNDFQPESGQTILGSDPLTGAVAGVGYATTNSAQGNYLAIERAIFANLTFHITDKLSVQIGGRDSYYISETYPATFTGPYDEYQWGQASPFVYPASTMTSKSPSAATYLLTPEYRLSPDFMVYTRLASGFRPGGSQTVPDAPSQYEPDKTINYEIGTKGDLLDHAISVDASLYYIDWKDIQLSLVTPNGAYLYTGNGGRAKSQGLELSADARPLTGLKISGWIVFSEAELTTFPLAALEAGTYATPGESLPGSSRFSGNLSARQEFPLSSNATGFVEATVAYMGQREGLLLSSNYPAIPGPRQEFPAYAKTDLRAGAKYNSWTMNLYVNNVANRLALLSGGGGNFFAFSYYEIPPRSVGVSVSKSF
jgi:iron complex outermembrane recepter protein